MSIDDEYSAGDTVTAALSPAESDADEFDDWLGVCRIGEGLGNCMLIELSDLRVLNYYYIYLKESRESTPYSESPVRAHPPL
jgi:hypothetical protein